MRLKCPIGGSVNCDNLSEKPELFKTHMAVWHTAEERGKIILALVKFWNMKEAPVLV